MDTLRKIGTRFDSPAWEVNPLLSHALDERVAGHAVLLGHPMEFETKRVV
jgi:hypothetical protein